MKIGHHLLDLVDLVGTSPYNRMAQVICQTINGSSIPTSAGMTVYMEITGRYLKSSANGCWYSTGDGAWGSEKFYHRAENSQKVLFYKTPWVVADMKHTSARFSYFLAPRREGSWGLGKADGQIQVKSRLTSIPSGFMVKLQGNGNFPFLFSTRKLKPNDSFGKGKDQRFSQLMRT